jgi:CYTH domain-containing protein
MSKEIEKKFLLKSLPEGIGQGIKILQGYLSVGDPEVRVRSKDDRFFLTRKGGEGFVREEEEYEISRQIFEILWPLTENARIEKTRYEIIVEDGLTWEIDEFHSAQTEGLFLAEIELPDESAKPLIPSNIAAVIEKDVTDDPVYKNKNLAVNGVSVDL